MKKVLACFAGCPRCDGLGLVLGQGWEYAECPICEGAGCRSCGRSGMVLVYGRRPDICPDCLIRARALDRVQAGAAP